VRRVLLVVLLALGLAPSAQAAPFIVGTGQHAGVAVDDGGTTYVGWQVNVYDPGDAVQLCVLPPRATRCASSVTVAFPGKGYNRSRVSVLLPAPNTVDVIVPRTDVGNDAHTFLARSTDGGRSFGPAVQIAEETFAQGVLGPGGRIALSDGPTTLHSALVSPSGADAAAEGSALGAFLQGVNNDVAAAGEEVLAAGSDAASSHAFRLPAGGNPNDPAAWQQIDPASGREPQLAGLPSGFAAMLEPISRGSLFVQRLEGAAWSPPVPVAPAVLNNDFRLLGSASGRLTALIAYPGYRLDYATSTDGGVLWSSLVTVARYRDYPSALEGATAGDGRGAAAVDFSLDDKSVRVTRFSPRSAPVARRRFGSARVQVRSVCDGDKLSLVVEAARGNRRVAPQTILRRARFGRARGARRGFRTRFRARYELRRRHARIPVRVIPRRGKARTLRLRVRRCGATR
jgi:hypothetical protein